MLRNKPATPRQKACLACADSKRSCDKQLPECQRCLDRDVDCVYPQPRRRRCRDASSTHAFTSSALLDFGDSGTGHSQTDLGSWNPTSMDLGVVDLSLPGMVVPYMFPSTPFPDPSLLGTSVGFELSPGKSSLWFLQEHTWARQHSSHEAACVSASELEPFVDIVRDMLQSWVKQGHNSFIHGRLYEYGMPPCVQDAFTTLAAYVDCTPAVKDTILQISDERSSSMIAPETSSTTTTTQRDEVLASLARVQALFVHMFIRLFDGSVRARASAERHIPTLRKWITHMWEAAKSYEGVPQWHEDGTALGNDGEYAAAMITWKQWILTESVRRTLLIVDTVANIYQIMTRGWAECAGAAMFTARTGLWDAESPIHWLQQSCAKPPLLVPSLQPGLLMAQCRADEVDDFVKTYWKFIAGSDRIQSWVDKSRLAHV